jgi:hypothetical protein
MNLWAFREIIRRFHDNNAVSNLHPTVDEPFAYIRQRFIHRLEFQCSTGRDAYDNDQAAPLFDALGLVHTAPDEPAPVFGDDNETPNSDDPTNNTPNVAEIGE